MANLSEVLAETTVKTNLDLQTYRNAQALDALFDPHLHFGHEQVRQLFFHPANVA